MEEPNQKMVYDGCASLRVRVSGGKPGLPNNISPLGIYPDVK